MCSAVSTENSPSRQTEHDDEQEYKEMGNRWLRQQTRSLPTNRCSVTNKTMKTNTLNRRHSHDCTPTSVNNCSECPMFTASLPVNLTVADGLQLLDDGSPTHSDDNHPLSVIGHDDCHQQDAAAAAADSSAPLCLAREILHELEEDLIESSEPPSSDNEPHTDQQVAALESTLQRSTVVLDDVAVLQEPSDSPRCWNDWASPAYDCDSEVCQTVGEVTLESNTSPSTSTDVGAVRALSLHDVSSAATDNSVSLRTSNTEPEAQAETIVGTLKNMFTYFITKLSGHDRNDVQSEPNNQQTPTSSCDGEKDTPQKHRYTHVVCPRDRKWLVGKNGASLCAAAHLAEILAARQKDGDVVAERMALSRPFGTLDCVLPLVPCRAVRELSRRRRRRNTLSNIDVTCKLHRRHGDKGAKQSAVVRRRPRSVTISTIPDWHWSITATPSPSSPSLSSSSSLRSSFYERKMIKDLEEAGAAADTDVGDTSRISLCVSDFCDDDDDDDAPVFPDVSDATVTDVNENESFSNLSSSSAKHTAVVM